MRETANSLVAPGAGRTCDIIWPSQSTMGGANLAVYSRVQYRAQASINTCGESITGTGAALGVALYKGALCYTLSAAVATVPGTGISIPIQQVQTSWAPNPVLAARTGFVGSGAITRQVSRIWANLAFVGTPASDQDFGLEFTCPPATTQPQTIIHGAIPGFGFVRRASGALSVVVLGPNGQIFNDVATPADYDPTVFNAYEFQITNPTATADATLACLLNGIVVHTETWGAGTNLPGYNAALAQPGIQLINYGGNNLSLNVQMWRFVTAPTLLDTL